MKVSQLAPPIAAKGIFYQVLLILPIALSAQNTASLSFIGSQSPIAISGQVSPTNVALDTSGDLFVLDRTGGQVIEIPAGGGAQQVAATGLTSPAAIAVDPSGNLYIAVGQNVLKVPAGGGSATALLIAGLANPAGLAADSSGNLYIADVGNAHVIELTSGGSQSNVGSGWLAPTGVAVDTSGNLYVADTALDHIVEILGGSGAPVALGSGLPTPSSVAVDWAGNVFAGAGNQVIRITSAGMQMSVGSGSFQALGLAARTNGTVFVADAVSNKIVEIQSVAVDFGSVNLCAPGQTGQAGCNESVTLNYAVNTATSLAAPSATTQGASNLDFTLAGGSTCTGNVVAGSTCSVNVNFTPRSSGARAGAVQLKDTNGNLQAQTAIHGTGNGAQRGSGSLVPATLASCLNGAQVAADAAGDVFAACPLQNQVLEVPAGGATPKVAAPGALGAALDGAGNLFTSDGSGNIYEAAFTGSGYAPVVRTPFSMSGVGTLAFDGAGDLFAFAYSAFLVTEFPAGGGAPIMIRLQYQLFAGTVDATGDVFIVNGFQILELPAGGGAFRVIAQGEFPQVAVDANGNLFAVPRGYPASLLEFPIGGGAPITLISNFLGGAGLAIDNAGDIFTTTGGELGTLIEYKRAALPAALPFQTTLVGSSSADSPHSVQIVNLGNQNLAISGLGFTNGVNFSLTPGSGSPPDCTSSSVIAPAFGCNLAVSFNPASVGNLSDALTLTDNSLNGTSSMQSILLTGGGVSAPQATTASVTSSTPNSIYGQPVTLTATVTSAIGTPLGTVTFVSGTTTLGTATLNTAGVATFSSNYIPAGNYMVTANYAGAPLFTASVSPAVALNVASVSANLGSVNVCLGTTKPAPCSQTQTLTYIVAASDTLATPIVSTQGIPNRDFTLAGTTCTGSVTAGSQCTISVKFSPQSAGSRLGAAEILNTNGNILQTFFLSGIGTAAQAAFNGATATAVPNSTSSSPGGVAIDGAGNLYISDGNSGHLYELPANGGPAITLWSDPGYFFAGPVAIDGAGNIVSQDEYGHLYKLPAGAGQLVDIGSFSGVVCLLFDPQGDLLVLDYLGIVYKLPAGGGPQVTLLSGLFNPQSMTLDKSGNLLVADFNPSSYNPQIEVIPAAGGTRTSIPLPNIYPAGLAVDAAGNLFLMDENTNNLLEIPADNSGLFTVANPPGYVYYGAQLAVDASGNIFVVDTVLSEIQRSQPFAFNFASTTVKTTSIDSPLSISLQNIGDAPLTLSKLKIGAQFAQVAGSGTPVDCSGSSSLIPGASCNLSIRFTPATVETFQTSATVSDNSLNGAPATQSIVLTGTSTPKIASTLALASSSNPVTFGQPVTFTATVTAPSGPTPTGSVTFRHSGVILATVPLSNGAASFTTSTLPAGQSVSVVAVYSGSAFDIGSRTTFTETIQKSSTATTLTSNMNPVFGETAVVLTASVTAASGPIPGGVVEFKSGSSVLGKAILNGGVAALTTSALPAGNPDNLTAIYLGSASDAASTSPVYAQIVNQYPTVTTLTSSMNPSPAGQPVTFTAIVTAQAGPNPTGEVNFKRGGSLLGSATLASGVASITTSSLPAHTNDGITAVFTGSQADAASTSAVLPQIIQ